VQIKSVIVAAKRTPIGSFQGQLSSLTASDLASHLIINIMRDLDIPADAVDEVILGNVLSAGQGQSPARQAAIKGGLPNTVETLTINKMCGSGLKAIMLADQAIKSNSADIIIAGGMESMSNAPHILQNFRTGNKLGHSKVIDSVIHDGLWDVYTNQHMGNCAEMLVKDRQYSREDQDAYAVSSYRKANSAKKANIFKDEIIPIEVKIKNEKMLISDDEEPSRVDYDKISKLKPAFVQNGTITAANASKLNDGASVVLIMSYSKAQELGLEPLAFVMEHVSCAHEPEWFTTAPRKAIQRVLRKSKMKHTDIDLWEINEAFSVVAMAAIDDLKISPSKVNIYGGAVALGHPIGASGARILTTLIHGMGKTSSNLGLASLCIGGGEASAIIVKRYD